MFFGYGNGMQGCVGGDRNAVHAAWGEACETSIVPLDSMAASTGGFAVVGGLNHASVDSARPSGGSTVPSSLGVRLVSAGPADAGGAMATAQPLGDDLEHA